MSQVEKIRRDLTTAMKADERVRVSVLRMLLAALHNEEIELRRELRDEDVIRILRREIKQREESVREFNRGGREDLVQNEEAESAILQEYAPKLMEEEEIEKYVDEAIAEVGASEQRDLGRVMAVLMPRLSGKADGAVVNRIVKEKLAAEDA
jgi:uncharacterized protein YqeY